MEKYHVVRAQLRADTGPILTAQYAGPKPFDLRTVYTALALVLQKHRALSTQVNVADTDHPFFVSLKSVDLSQVVRFHDPEEYSLETVMNSYLVNHFKYGTTTPLWRLGVMSDNTLIFHFDHSIGDGQSGLAFHKDFLDALNTISVDPETQASTVVSISDSLVLNPPLEDKMRVPLTFIRILKVILSMLIPARWQKAGWTWTGGIISRQDTIRVNTRLWTLTAGQTNRLLKACRAHQTTITSFLYTAGTTAFSNVLQRDSTKQSKYIVTSIPVSLRRFTGTSADSFCDQVGDVSWVSSIPRNRSEGVANPWSAAARHSISLRKRVSSAVEAVGLLKLLRGQYVGYFEGMFGKKRSTTLEISNVGRFPLSKPVDKEGKKWRIEEMFFGQCNAVFGPAFKLSVVGSQQGSLGLCFNWTEGVVDEHLAQEFVDLFKKFIVDNLRLEE